MVKLKCKCWFSVLYGTHIPNIFSTSGLLLSKFQDKKPGMTQQSKPTERITQTICNYVHKANCKTNHKELAKCCLSVFLHFSIETISETRLQTKMLKYITCQSVSLQSVLKINLNSCFTWGDYRRNKCVGMNAALNEASSWNDHAFFTISFLPDLFLEKSGKVIAWLSYVFLFLLFLYFSGSASLCRQQFSE